MSSPEGARKVLGGGLRCFGDHRCCWTKRRHFKKPVGRATHRLRLSELETCATAFDFRGDRQRDPNVRFIVRSSCCGRREVSADTTASGPLSFAAPAQLQRHKREHEQRRVGTRLVNNRVRDWRWSFRRQGRGRLA